MLFKTLMTSSEVILLAVITGLPGALIGTGVGAWRKPDNRALGALLGFILGFFASFAIAVAVLYAILD